MADVAFDFGGVRAGRSDFALLCAGSRGGIALCPAERRADAVLFDRRHRHCRQHPAGGLRTRRCDSFTGILSSVDHSHRLLESSRLGGVFKFLDCPVLSQPPQQGCQHDRQALPAQGTVNCGVLHLSSPTAELLRWCKPNEIVSLGYLDISIGRGRFSSTLAAPGKKGTGGRSSVSGYVATVFGATGFLGRYVVQQLARMGSQVFVPYRGLEDESKHLKLMGDLGQVVPVRFDSRDEASIKAAISRSNVVINLIGILRPIILAEEINVSIPERLSRLAREHGNIGRYVQVSCLGASFENPAKQYQTKAEGEKVTLENFPEVALVFEAIREESRVMHIPFSVAKLMAAPEQIMRRFSFPTPKMVTFSQNHIDSLQVDYVVTKGALTFQEMGIKPRKLEGVHIEHLYQYRTGGPAMGTTVGVHTRGAGF